MSAPAPRTVGSSCSGRACFVPTSLLLLAGVSLLLQRDVDGALPAEGSSAWHSSAPGSSALLSSAPGISALLGGAPDAALACREQGNVTLVDGRIRPDQKDPAGPTGIFQDWVVTPETSVRGPVVGVVLLRHISVHVYNFDMFEAPPWAQQIFTVNRDFCTKHGYKMVLREGGRAPPTSWQSAKCAAKGGTPDDIFKCESAPDRDNNCAEKCAMMLRYLQEFGASHVMILDADAAIVNQESDTIANLVQELESSGKDILLADEDYKKRGGAGRINCAMMFAKNTEFSRGLFASLVRAHDEGPAYSGPGAACKNECDCMKTWMKSYPGLQEKLLVVSGLRYNRQECTFRCCTACPTNTALEGLNSTREDDPSFEIVHFTSGNSRGAARHFGPLTNVDFKGAVKRFMSERTPDRCPT